MWGAFFFAAVAVWLRLLMLFAWATSTLAGGSCRIDGL
jgi:hypothetical protein